MVDPVKVRYLNFKGRKPEFIRGYVGPSLEGKFYHIYDIQPTDDGWSVCLMEIDNDA